MEKTEDHTAPVSEAEISKAIAGEDKWALSELVGKVLSAFNQKRDSYNGVVSSMIYLIESEHDTAITGLRDGLIAHLTQRPMSFAGKTFLTKALYRLIQEQPEFIQDFFEYLISEECSAKWRKNFRGEESQVLKIQITALKAIKQAESSKDGRPTKLSSEYIDRLCMASISRGDDATRIDTLSLILESRSTTKLFEDKELETYEIIFMDAICLQDAALRQVFIALTGKLLKRLIDSFRVVKRDKKKFTDQDRQVLTIRYNKFLSWLIQTCLDSNYCNAYFGSFVLTISTLKLIILHVTFDEPALPIEPLLNSRRCYDSILSCLGDSFEENKILALSLLLSLPYNEVFFTDANVKIFSDIAYDLIDSINPAHSLTCQYVFKLLVGIEERKARAMGSEEISKNRLLLKHLNTLIDQIEGSVKSAEDNFTLALKGKPVYPKLTCIRSLLEEVEINDLESDREQWVDLCHRVVNVSIEACGAVSTIVCNLNPETIGHLPMDLKPVDAESLAKSFNLSINIEDSEYNTMSSQMLLISGWKTIKECSLSLGTLCTRFWWPKDGIKAKKEKFPGLKTAPVLARDDILKILEYFDHYLRNLRHRGAFEQAYNGYIMVTRRIWNDEDFRGLLIKTLNEIMDDFRTDSVLSDDRADSLKAYVTRRSAGLPLVVQAILISEHKKESVVLDSIMNGLFKVLRSDQSQEYQRIHCMNILRALIKEHNLGEKVLKHVGETLSITLKAFRSDSFPIRNCANMLLKAVVDRTFGVNRLKDEIHRRNQLSFEKFFSDFPRLYDEMINYLDTDVNDKRYLPSIHPVLIVLNRLKASKTPSPAYKFEQIIKPFVYKVMKWALHCPDYKLREVAAKTCVQLFTYSQLEDPQADISQLEQDLDSNLKAPDEGPNNLHGRLALAKFLIESRIILFKKKSLRETIWSMLIGVHQRSLSIPGYESLELSFVAAVESWLRYATLPLLIDDHTLVLFGGLLKIYTEDTSYRGHPLSEQALFKCICVQLIDYILSSNLRPHPIFKNLKYEVANLVFKSGRCSLNLQASVIRLLRQLHQRPEDIAEELHRQLDLDSTAVYQTPFDELKYRKDEALECAPLEAYLKQNSSHLKLALGVEIKYPDFLQPFITCMTNLSNFDEFKPVKIDAEGACHFSPRSSNTPRAIELLAWANKTLGSELVECKIICQHPDETGAEKLKFLREFLTNLADCDVKSLAIILAGRLIKRAIRYSNKRTLEEITKFSPLMGELANDNHSYVVRKACCHFLKYTFTSMLQQKEEIGDRCLAQFMSAIIKLTKDSENEIRSISFAIVASLDGNRSAEETQPDVVDLCGSRLDPLIRVIVDGSIFDANNAEHTSLVLELLCQIIFDHGKNYSNDSDDEQEHLFDKTKLNTFADHIAATRSALQGLYQFFKRRTDNLSLDSIKLPSDVLIELSSGLKVTLPSKGNATGDYSWRLQLNSANTTGSPGAANIAAEPRKVIDELLREILDSIQYFARGYWNILTDTEYIYHELSLYRRLAFVKFILDCVERNPDSQTKLQQIKQELHRLVQDSCATTILTKCIDLLEGDQITSD